MNTEKKTGDSPESAISKEEKKLLDESLDLDINGDDLNLKRAQLNHTDEDGELLNEMSSGDTFIENDLDIPGAEQDDANEEIGEEDEENNGYSQADTA
ncbi:MAG: hypothetical protein JST81_14000 [Bacteroidetes bacterium]|nr:hypothetical protein [Bacteroidota bacterium]